jgi:MATE family multidrug resistance protein
MAVQFFVDAVLLGRHNPLEMAAAFVAMMWYWLGFGFLSVTAGYVSTFVAQYTGAKRPHRVGPAVWQGIHFALASGLLFLLIVHPLAPTLMALSGHDAELVPLQVTYLQCLSFAALPMLVMAAANGFFSGRGQTWTVLGIEVFGTAVNVGLALVLIWGRLGFPEMGIAGAGWATVAGSWASALLAVGMLMRPTFRREFHTLRGWRPEGRLFRRLLWYGLPAGLQVFLEVLVFHVFVLLVQGLGVAAIGAVSLTVRLNMVSFLPMMGIGLAISILVGQRLGANRPDLAEKSAYTGLKWAFGYMCCVAAVYLLFPRLLVSLFESEADPATFEAVAALVPGLLACVAVYSLAEAVNVAFAFALRGAGDTWFVSLVTFALGWPIMVLPTYLVVVAGGSLYWAWGCVTAYVLVIALSFYLRFRTGKWKTMRVIEPDLTAEEADRPAPAAVPDAVAR